jgi:hypothetical protein
MFKAIESANRILAEVGTRNAIHDLALNGEGTAGIQLKSGLKLFFEYVGWHKIMPRFKVPMIALRPQHVSIWKKSGAEKIY